MTALGPAFLFVLNVEMIEEISFPSVGSTAIELGISSKFKVQRKKIAVVGETIFFTQVPVMSVSKSGSVMKICNEIILELQARSSM